MINDEMKNRVQSWCASMEARESCSNYSPCTMESHHWDVTQTDYFFFFSKIAKAQFPRSHGKV